MRWVEDSGFGGGLLGWVEVCEAGGRFVGLGGGLLSWLEIFWRWLEAG